MSQSYISLKPKYFNAEQGEFCDICGKCVELLSVYSIYTEDKINVYPLQICLICVMNGFYKLKRRERA